MDIKGKSPDEKSVNTEKSQDDMKAIIAARKKEKEDLKREIRRSVDAKMLRDAIAAYHSKNYEDALPIIWSMADEGNREAQYYYGQMYFFGRGVEENHKKAFHYTQLAAQQDDRYACMFLGSMFDAGKGTGRDLKKAVYWLEKSIELGNNSDDVKELLSLVKEDLELEEDLPASQVGKTVPVPPETETTVTPAPQQDNYTQKETKECNISYYMNLIKKGCNIVLGGTAQDRNSFEKEYLNKNPGSKFVMYSEIENFKKNIFGPKTVFGVIQKAKSIKGTSTQDITRVFQNMNIAHLKDRAPTAMSGGQKVKCSMALYILEGKRNFLFVDGHPYGDIILSSVATDAHKDVTIVWVSSHTAEELLQNDFIKNCNLIALDQVTQAVIDNKNAVKDKKQIETTEVQEKIQPVLLVEEKTSAAEETEIVTETPAPQAVVKEEPKEAIVIPVNKTEETYTRDAEKSKAIMTRWKEKHPDDYVLSDVLIEFFVEDYISSGVYEPKKLHITFDGKRYVFDNTQLTWESLYIVVCSIIGYDHSRDKMPNPDEILKNLFHFHYYDFFQEYLTDLVGTLEGFIGGSLNILGDIWSAINENEFTVKHFADLIAQILLPPEKAFVDGRDFALSVAGRTVKFHKTEEEMLKFASENDIDVTMDEKASAEEETTSLEESVAESVEAEKTAPYFERDVDKSIMMMDEYSKKNKNSYTLWDFLPDKRDVEYWISTGFEKAVDVPVIYDGKQRIIRNTEATWEDLYIILSAITSFMVGGNIPHPYQKLYDVVNADRIEGTFEDILNDVLAEYEEVLCCLTAVLDDGEMSEDKLFIDVVNVLAQVWLTPEHAFVDGTDFAFAQAGKEITFDYKQYEYLNSTQDAGEKEELYFDEFVKAAEKCKTKEEFLTLVDRVNESESKDIALYIAKKFEEGIIIGQADRILAKPWYIKAAELGSSTAAYRLAQLHLENGGKKFSEEYIDYMERALDNGEVSVAKELAKLYMDKRTKFYDIEKAAYALQRGRKYSDIDCMYEEAVLYMEYGKELNDDAALVDMHIYSLLQESAARGNKKALKLFQEHFQI